MCVCLCIEGVDDGEKKSGVKLKMNCLSLRNALQRGAGILALFCSGYKKKKERKKRNLFPHLFFRLAPFFIPPPTVGL